MTVHAISKGKIVETVLANRRRRDGRLGFLIQFEQEVDPRYLRILLGETDETLVASGAPSFEGAKELSIEDIISFVEPRPWASGACYLEGLRAGLKITTILDLLCRDYLGRPAEIELLGEAVATLPLVGFDGFRQRLIKSVEYRSRDMNGANAPGAIFSSALVSSVAHNDYDIFAITPPPGPPRAIDFPPEFLEPNFPINDMIAQAYRIVFSKDPLDSMITKYAEMFKDGKSRLDILVAVAEGK